MRSFASALLIAVTSATNLLDVADYVAEKSVRVSSLGAIVTEKVFEDKVERYIAFPDDPTGQIQQTSMIQSMTE